MKAEKEKVTQSGKLAHLVPPLECVFLSEAILVILSMLRQLYTFLKAAHVVKLGDTLTISVVSKNAVVTYGGKAS